MLTFSEVKTAQVRYEIPAEKKQRKNQKTGKMEEVTVFERFTALAPVGYRMDALRNRIRPAFQRIASGESNRVELSLYRFPQVNTVIGEMRGLYPKLKLRTGWTSDDEENTLFVIERIR